MPRKPAKKPRPVSLPESDYLAILDTICTLHRCRTRADLLDILKDVLLPLFNSQAGLYIWTDANFSQSTGLIGNVGIPEKEIDVFLQMAPYVKFNQVMFEQSRTVFAHDIDMPRKESVEDIARFLMHHPEYDNENYPYFKRFKSALVTADMPEPTLAVALHRIDDCVEVWTCRDVRVMELLRPHLLQTIKTICLNAELARYKALSEALADSPTAVALATVDFRLVFHNAAFVELFPDVERGKRLPANLGKLLQRDAVKFELPSKDQLEGGIELPFCTTAKGTYRAGIDQVGEEDKYWLVRLKPVVEPYARLSLLTQEYSLSKREQEIVCLVRDGMTNEEIGERLFISPETVKTHLKSIYRKLDAKTRLALINKLNAAWQGGIAASY